MDKDTLIGVAAIVIIVVAFFSIGNPDSSSEDGYYCESCETTYTDEDNRESIIWNNLCVDCYKNFQDTQKLMEAADDILKEEGQDGLEGYGESEY